MKLKIILSFTLVVIVLTSVLSIFSFDQQRKIIERDVERRAMTIAEHVGLSSLKAIVSGYTLSLNDIIDESMTDKNVLYAMVLDAAGHVRMHNEDVNIGKVFDDDLTKKAIKADKPYSKCAVKGEVHVHDIVYPVFFEEELLGVVRLGYSFSETDAAILSIKRSVITSASLVFVVGLLINICLALLIVRPLKVLEGDTRKIAGGDLNVLIDTAAKDDVGRLALNINIIVKKLRESFDNLDQKVKQKSDRITGN